MTYAFVEEALPRLEAEGLDPASTTWPAPSCSTCCRRSEQRAIFPEERAREAMGITGFTLPTMYRWVRSDAGRAGRCTPSEGPLPGQRPGRDGAAEAGLDGESQARAIVRYAGANRCKKKKHDIL